MKSWWKLSVLLFAWLAGVSLVHAVPVIPSPAGNVEWSLIERTARGSRNQIQSTKHEARNKFKIEMGESCWKNKKLADSRTDYTSHDSMAVGNERIPSFENHETEVAIKLNE